MNALGGSAGAGVSSLPAIPSQFNITPSSTSASFSWSAATTPKAYPVLQYKVVISPGQKNCLVKALKATKYSCVIGGLIPNTSYIATVSASNHFGWGQVKRINFLTTPIATALSVLTGPQTGGVIGNPSLPAGWIVSNGYYIGPGANLTGANLVGANLTGATLTGAQITNANFANSTLTGIISGTLNGTPTLLPNGWTIISGYLVGPGANLTGATLGNATLTNTNLAGTIMTGANLSHVISGNISGVPASLPSGWQVLGGYLLGPSANLSGAILSSLNLNGVNLSAATLTNVVSESLTGSPTLPSGWSIISGYLVGPGANLSGANFTGANLSGLNLCATNFSSANLTNSNLSRTTLCNANLSNATLTGVISGGVTATVNLLPTGWILSSGYLLGPGANLTGANLSGASIYTAVNLTGAILTGANLNGTALSNAVLTGVVSGGITGSPYQLPAFYQLINGYLVGNGISLVGANFSNISLTGKAFTGISFAGANFSNTDLTGTSFSGDNLSNVNFSNTNLSGCVLTGTTLAGTNFTGATLKGVVTGTAAGTPSTLPTSWIFADGYLVGPGANLSGATLSSVNLTGVDLTGATLTGLSASSITGNPTLPTNWFISMGYLIGPNANLTGANLTGINLSNKYLVIINFTNANLTNANLAGANFNSANFSGADLSGAVLTGSDFSYANITNAIMATSLITGITYTGLVGGPPASLPTGWRWNVGQLIQG